MNIKGTSSRVDIEYKGKTARFYGELGFGLLENGEVDMGTHAFLAAKSSMHWLPPHHKRAVKEKEKDALIDAVNKYMEDKEVKIIFNDF